MVRSQITPITRNLLRNVLWILWYEYHWKSIVESEVESRNVRGRTCREVGNRRDANGESALLILVLHITRSYRLQLLVSSRLTFWECLLFPPVNRFVNVSFETRFAEAKFLKVHSSRRNDSVGALSVIHLNNSRPSLLAELGSEENNKSKDLKLLVNRRNFDVIADVGQTTLAVYPRVQRGHLLQSERGRKATCRHSRRLFRLLRFCCVLARGSCRIDRFVCGMPVCSATTQTLALFTLEYLFRRLCWRVLALFTAHLSYNTYVPTIFANLLLSRW